MKKLFIFLSTLALLSTTSCAQKEKIYLLVRADDMGVTHATNLACIDVCTKGISRTIEIMPPCPWFPEAVEMLKENPNIDIGLHLSLTSEWTNYKWKPLSAAKSIVNKYGHFYTNYWDNGLIPKEEILLNNPWTIEDVEKELRAQIEYALRLLPNRISHMNMHMGGRNADPKITEVFDRLEKEYDLQINFDDYGFKGFKAFGEESAKISAEEKTLRLIENLKKLTAGNYIFIDHPSYNTPEMQAISHPGYEMVGEDREGVTKAWTDPRVLDIIKEKEIILINYQDIKDGKVPKRS